MKNTLSALTVLILMTAIEPITDGLMLLSSYWQPIACVLIAGAVWLGWSRYERRGVLK